MLMVHKPELLESLLHYFSRGGNVKAKNATVHTVSNAVNIYMLWQKYFRAHRNKQRGRRHDDMFF